LNALSENGYADLAYTLASRDSFPSWGWWIANGATTLYEHWAIDKGDFSRNHIMFGEISAWFYKALGGILPDASRPGFQHILLRPHFVAGLEHFEASHDGPYGTIRSSWRRLDSTIVYTVTVPPNSSATLRLAIGDGSRPLRRVVVRTTYLRDPHLRSQVRTTALEYELPAGSYTFELWP